MNIDDSTFEHRQVWDLIPWVLNNTASEAERAEVQRHLDSCDDCREEYEFQLSLQAHVSRGSSLRRDPSPALERLWARIDDSVLPAAGWQRPTPGAWLVRGLAFAVVLEAIGLGVTGSALWTGPAAPAASYHTLTAPAATPASASIRAVFDSKLSLGQLQALLQPLQLQVVGGPSEAGVYSLALNHGQPSPALLASLRAQPGVSFAEPIDAGGK